MEVPRVPEKLLQEGKVLDKYLTVVIDDTDIFIIVSQVTIRVI